MSIFAFAACEKNGGEDNGNDSNGKPSDIDGTEISTSSDLYGTITDIYGNPIEGVAVTDGRTVVLTDANGVYQMGRSKLSKYVYYSTPADYEVNLASDGIPLFYQEIDQTQAYVQADFQLTPLSSSESHFMLMCIADPQCVSTSNVSRFKLESMVDVKETAQKYRSAGTPVYGVTLGDIVYDSPELWPDMRESMAGDIPIFQTIGNHDHLAYADGETEATANYLEYFGPTDYSFNRGNAHIVVMDNVIYTGGAGGNNYKGGLTKNQLSWLQQDLSYVDKSKIVLFCAHIPFRDHNDEIDESYAYADDVLDAVSGFAETHLMIGHTHYNENYVHTINGNEFIEHIHGAVCGGWWANNINPDGAPNGYGVYEFNGSHIENYYYKSTGKDEDYQMRAYPGPQVFGSSSATTFSWGANNSTLNNSKCIVVDVWNAIIASRSSTYGWTVELYQDGKKVCNMTQKSMTEYWAYGDYVLNRSKSETSTYSKTRTHLYYGNLSSGDVTTDSDSDLNFEIRVTDQFGNVYTCSTLTRDFNGA